MKYVKFFLGAIRSYIHGIKISNFNIYIGSKCNIKGGHLIELGSECVVRPSVSLWASGKGISIGSGCEIGERCRFSIVNKLQIGKNVLFSPNVYITDCDHKYNDISNPIKNQGVVLNDNVVEVGDDSFVGINVVIIGNVKIGKHCVVGANSVVTESIPDYSVAVGVPAKVIRKYDFIDSKWISVK